MSEILDSNDIEIGVARETTWSVLDPGTDKHMVRSTGEGLESTRESITSSEFSKKGGVTDRIKTGGGAGGDFNFEWSLGTEMILLLELAMRGLIDSTTGILKAENTKQSCLIEKHIPIEGGVQYFRYAGCRAGSIGLTVAQDQIATGTFTVQGKNETLSEVALANPVIPVNENQVISSFEVRNLFIGGITNEVIFTNLGWTLNNAVRSQRGFSSTVKIGDAADRDSKGIAFGVRDNSGTLTAFFSESELYQIASGEQDVPVSFIVGHDDLAYAITFPRVTFANTAAKAQSNDSDFMQDLTWGASIDPDIGTDMIVFTKAAQDTVLNVTAPGGDLAIDVTGEYVHVSGTVATADAVYVRRDGMFVLEQNVSNEFEFHQTGGKVFYTGGADVTDVYVADAGFEGEVPTVTAV